MEDSIWKKIAVQIVGGLFQVGFAENSDLLLVLSHDGRGIFNCLTGEKIARDRNDFQKLFSEETLIAKGFNLLEDEEIKTAGLYGGTLSTKTQDAWKLSSSQLNDDIIEIYLRIGNSDNQMLVGDNKIAEIKAFGFSETGKSFVIATSADLTIFSRQL